MNIKQYLSQAYRLDQIINSKLEQVEVLENMATKVTSNIQAERVSGTKQQSPMENSIVKLIDLKNEINMDIDKLVDLKHELTTFVSQIENPTYRLILELKYIGGHTWEEIAEILNYDLRWIYRLRGKALQEAEKLLNKPL